MACFRPDTGYYSGTGFESEGDRYIGDCVAVAVANYLLCLSAGGCAADYRAKYASIRTGGISQLEVERYNRTISRIQSVAEALRDDPAYKHDNYSWDRFAVPSLIERVLNRHWIGEDADAGLSEVKLFLMPHISFEGWDQCGHHVEQARGRLDFRFPTIIYTYFEDLEASHYWVLAKESLSSKSTVMIDSDGNAHPARCATRGSRIYFVADPQNRPMDQDYRLDGLLTIDGLARA